MQSSKTIAVKLYLDPDTYLSIKTACDASGLSMSSAGNLALRQWESAHRIRRDTRVDMPKTAPKRALRLPGSRRGAPVPHMRV